MDRIAIWSGEALVVTADHRSCGAKPGMPIWIVLRTASSREHYQSSGSGSPIHGPSTPTTLLRDDSRSAAA